MIYPQDKRTPEQQSAMEQFQSGYNAFLMRLNFSPALNEGDYSGYFWAGWDAARAVFKDSKNKSQNEVYNWNEAKVKIKWKY